MKVRTNFGLRIGQVWRSSDPRRLSAFRIVDFHSIVKRNRILGTDVEVVSVYPERPGSRRIRADHFQILGPKAKGDVRMVYNNAWNYPDICWGNYAKVPVIMGRFYQNAVRVRLTGSDQ